MSPDRSITFWCAVVVGSAGAFVAASTFLPLGWVIPEGVTFGLFLLIFPVFGFAVVRESRSGTPTKPTDLLHRVPHPAKVVLGAAWVVLWLSIMSSFLGPSGQPTTENGRLYLNNHGDLTEVDQRTYDEAQNRGARGFTSGAAAFCIAAAVMSKYGGRKDER